MRPHDANGLAVHVEAHQPVELEVPLPRVRLAELLFWYYQLIIRHSDRFSNIFKRKFYLYTISWQKCYGV